MAKVVWTTRALSGLDEIASHIARDNPVAAEILVQRVFGFVEHLKRFPELGRVPPELRGFGRSGTVSCRELVVRPCRIFYRFDAGGDVVLVLNVIRGERDISPQMIDPSREQT